MRGLQSISYMKQAGRKVALTKDRHAVWLDYRASQNRWCADRKYIRPVKFNGLLGALILFVDGIPELRPVCVVLARPYCFCLRYGQPRLIWSTYPELM
jgi:hypothetical protein